MLLTLLPGHALAVPDAEEAVSDLSNLWEDFALVGQSVVSLANAARAEFGMVFDANSGLPAIQAVEAHVEGGVQFGSMVTDPRVVTPVHPDGYPFLGWSESSDNDPDGVIRPATIWTSASAQTQTALSSQMYSAPFPAPIPLFERCGQVEPHSESPA